MTSTIGLIHLPPHETGDGITPMRMRYGNGDHGDQKQDEDPIEYLVGGIPADLDITGLLHSSNAEAAGLQGHTPLLGVGQR